MASKIEAAAISRRANIETWIVNGLEDHFITNAFENKVPFTKIITRLKPLAKINI
jgi:glutamate 5-kinase